MKRTDFFALALLSVAMFVACDTPTASSQFTPTKAGPGYRFEEATQHSASPCAVCVGFSATTRYVQGNNITWNICQTNQPKGYLDLKVARRGRSLKVRLLRDCSDPAAIKVLLCPGEDSDEFNIFKVSFSEGNSDVFIDEKGGGTGVVAHVLRVTVPTTNQIGIELKSGWILDYDRQSCSGN